MSKRVSIRLATTLHNWRRHWSVTVLGPPLLQPRRRPTFLSQLCGRELFLSASVKPLQQGVQHDLEFVLLRFSKVYPFAFRTHVHHGGWRTGSVLKALEIDRTRKRVVGCSRKQPKLVRTRHTKSILTNATRTILSTIGYDFLAGFTGKPVDTHGRWLCYHQRTEPYPSVNAHVVFFCVTDSPRLRKHT